MADKPKDRRNRGQTMVPPASNPGKRPHAMLDLKATEIKVSPLSDPSKSQSKTTAREQSVSNSPTSSASAVPTPMPASDYAKATSAQPTEAAKPSADRAGATTATPASAAKTAASATPTDTAKASTIKPDNAQPASKAPAPNVKPQKHGGGFLSHLIAAVLGGVIALAGLKWALPQLGIAFDNSQSAETAALTQRLAALEGRDAGQNIDTRFKALETETARIPALIESQTRLVADTKAALAAAASDKGEPELITRLAALEGKLKAMQDAGANDPNANRVEQLAALTGKVSDIERTVSSQLSNFRQNVLNDVEARIAPLSTLAETAKVSALRVDKDVSAIKSNTVLLDERMTGLKTESDKLAASVQIAAEKTESLGKEVEALKASVASPADVSSAINPVSQKLADLESNVDELTKAEGERRADSQRVLLSIELQNLKRAVASGHEYAPELAATQKAAAGKYDLSALEPFKSEGVPTQTDLIKEFRSIANAAIDADAEPQNANFTDRLLAGAKSIIRVRKIDYPDGDKSTEAVIGRMEMALKAGKYSEVLAQAKDLSAPAQTASKAFLDRVTARVSIDDTISKVEDRLKSSFAAAPAGEAQH